MQTAVDEKPEPGVTPPLHRLVVRGDLRLGKRSLGNRSGGDERYDQVLQRGGSHRFLGEKLIGGDHRENRIGQRRRGAGVRGNIGAERVGQVEGAVWRPAEQRAQ